MPDTTVGPKLRAGFVLIPDMSTSKGQLKPQLKQIAASSSIFGEEVSTFAAKILKDHFEDSI
jgi:hypothetical protein